MCRNLLNHPSSFVWIFGRLNNAKYRRTGRVCGRLAFRDMVALQIKHENDWSDNLLVYWDGRKTNIL